MPIHYPRYASVVLDVDSTLSQLEGIDWLAARRGQDVVKAVADMTDRAMHGLIPLHTVYGERLALVRPSRADVMALGQAYIEAIVPDAQRVVAVLRDASVRVVMISGGVRQALLPLATFLSIADTDVVGVALHFADDGAYAGYDTTSPVSRNGGKPIAVRQLRLPHPVLAVGDGSTDAELKTDREAPVETFAAFIGVAERAPVVAVADVVVRELSELLPLVLGPHEERV